MSPHAERVRAALDSGEHYRYRNELALHLALDERLTAAGIEHVREVRVHGGRIDFMCPSPESTLGIEVKVAGSATALHAQLNRYARDDRIDELLVVTTRPTHRAMDRKILKPLDILVIGGIGR